MQLKENSVYGERIKEAREIKGYSQTTLAELLGVQNATVSAYEKNKINPSSEVLFQIASITQFPVTFFLNKRAHDQSIRSSPVTFRKLTSATKVARTQGERYEDLVYDIFHSLSPYVSFTAPNVPFFEVDYKKITKEEIENIAETTRRKWGMGDGPIANLIQFLENNGILISTAVLDHRLDAFSTWREKQPIILLSDNNRSCVRRRYNLAHELGHLALHATLSEDDLLDKEMHKRIEAQANYFAGAFLLPRKSFSSEYFSNSMTALVHLKARWKVSIAAIGMRLQSLGIINANQNTYINIQLNQTAGGKKNEILDDTIPMEVPSLLKDAFTLLATSKILTIREAIDSLGISEECFLELTGVPESLLYENNQNQTLRFQIKQP